MKSCSFWTLLACIVKWTIPFSGFTSRNFIVMYKTTLWNRYFQTFSVLFFAIIYICLPYFLLLLLFGKIFAWDEFKWRNMVREDLYSWHQIVWDWSIVVVICYCKSLANYTINIMNFRWLSYPIVNSWLSNRTLIKS